MGGFNNLWRSLQNPYLKGKDKPVGRQREFFAKESIDYIQSLGRFANNNYNLEITPWGGETAIYNCRVEDSFDEQANTKRGDDWKDLLFYDDYPEITIGLKAKLHGCTWLGYNTRNIAALTSSVIIRRCDNVLNFVDEFGNVTAEPFVFDKYTVLNSTNIAKPADPATLINGYKNAWIQYNDLTATLQTNDRFIIQGKAFVVRGVDYYSRQTTEDRASVKLISFVLAKTEEVEGDDLVNDIANATANVWAVRTDMPSITGKVGVSGSLGAELLHNGIRNTEYGITYTVSDNSVVRVDESGIYEIVGEGDAVITCTFEKNPNVSTTISVTGTAEETADYFVAINPELSLLKQYESAELTATLFNGASATDEDVVITANGVPTQYYDFSQSGNTATIYCKAPYNKGNLTITAIATRDGEVYSSSVEVRLAGVL